MLCLGFVSHVIICNCVLLYHRACVSANIVICLCCCRVWKILLWTALTSKRIRIFRVLVRLLSLPWSACSRWFWRWRPPTSCGLASRINFQSASCLNKNALRLFGMIGCTIRFRGYISGARSRGIIFKNILSTSFMICFNKSNAAGPPNWSPVI